MKTLSRNPLIHGEYWGKANSSSRPTFKGCLQKLSVMILCSGDHLLLADYTTSNHLGTNRICKWI